MIELLGKFTCPDSPQTLHFEDLAPHIGVSVTSHQMNIVCVGAHPDDPETGCGGTLARLANAGNRVSIIYLTRGEAGVRNVDCDSTAKIRTEEAKRGVALLGAEAYFAGQLDGQTTTDRAAIEHFTSLLFSRSGTSYSRTGRLILIAITAPQRSSRTKHEALGESFTLAYFKVMTGVQTHHFEPNCHVDIASSSEQKRAAIYSHVCQNPDRFYPYHVKMERERGSEVLLERAEAFVVVREKLPRPCLSFRM